MPRPPRLFYSLLLVLANVYIGNSGKVLVYSPSISYSHLISNGRIADTLVDAGHEVVMFIPEYVSATSSFNGTKKAKLIRMNGIDARFEKDLEGMEEFMLSNERLGVQERVDFEYSITGMCDSIMKRRDELQVLIDYQFDVAFSEMLDLCGVGVIRYLGIKNHIWVSTTPIMDAVSYNLGIPAPSSYVPTIEENDNGDTMTFMQRAFNLYMYIATIYIHRLGTDMTTEVFRKYQPDFPNIREIAANSSLCFVNADEMFDLPRPIIHKTIYIGGLGNKAPSPLSEEFSRMMSKGKKGVIIMSLGSIIPFHALQDHMKKDVVKIVKSMSDYHFIFKIGKGDKSTEPYFKGIPNYDLVEWLPQSDILAHPRLKLFIMHGGLNGLTEALLNAVPLVVVPIFADQFRNGRNVEKRGIGKVVPKLDINERNLKNAIETVINDPSYKQRALRMAKLMAEKPFSPEERLAKWTTFAISNGVLEELHVEGSRMNSIVYFNLDVFAAFFTVIFIVIYLIYRFLTCLLCLIFSRSPVIKEKRN